MRIPIRRAILIASLLVLAIFLLTLRPNRLSPTDARATVKALLTATAAVPPILYPMPVQGDDRKWGYIDTTGKLVIQYQFDQAWGFGDGLASVKIGERWGYIDTT